MQGITTENPQPSGPLTGIVRELLRRLGQVIGGAPLTQTGLAPRPYASFSSCQIVRHLSFNISRLLI